MGTVTTKIKEEIGKLLPPTLFFFVILHIVAFIQALMNRNTSIALPRGELERRSGRLGLVTVALCAMLSGCALHIKSDLPAQMTAAPDLQCCRDQATDERPTVSTSTLEVATEPTDVASYGLCLFEVAVSESPLRRDAFGSAPIVGRVVPGEKLTYVDSIDRRLRVLGHVVFDGGHWRKVRGQRGDVGWLPAAEVRESRGSCDAG